MRTHPLGKPWRYLPNERTDGVWCRRGQIADACQPFQAGTAQRVAVEEAGR
jgi:hypothetical protein